MSYLMTCQWPSPLSKGATSKDYDESPVVLVDHWPRRTPGEARLAAVGGGGQTNLRAVVRALSRWQSHDCTNRPSLARKLSRKWLKRLFLLSVIGGNEVFVNTRDSWCNYRVLTTSDFTLVITVNRKSPAVRFCLHIWDREWGRWVQKS